MNNNPQKRKHKTVKVRVGTWQADIDEAIAPLIRQLWLAGIETDMCCQKDGWGLVWIQFSAEVDIIKFVNAIAEYEAEADTLYQRMNPASSRSLPTDEWQYEIFSADLGLHEEEPDKSGVCRTWHEGSADFYFAYSLRFPLYDLPTVLGRMKRHNRRLRSRKCAAVTTPRSDSQGG